MSASNGVAALVRITAPGPGQNNGSPLSSTASSANQAIPAGAKKIVLIGTQDFHVRFGSGAQTAVANDLLVPSKQFAVFDLLNGQDNFAVIRDSADGTVYWTHS